MGTGCWVVPWQRGPCSFISRALQGLDVGCPGASWKEPSCGEGTEAPKLPGGTSGRVWWEVLEHSTMSTHQGSLDCTPGTESLQAWGATELEKPLGSIHRGLPHGVCIGGSGRLCICGGSWAGLCWGQRNTANPPSGSTEVVSASRLSPLQLPPSLSLSSGQTSHCLWLPIHLSLPTPLHISLTFPLTRYLSLVAVVTCHLSPSPSLSVLLSHNFSFSLCPRLSVSPLPLPSHCALWHPSDDKEEPGGSTEQARLKDPTPGGHLLGEGHAGLQTPHAWLGQCPVDEVDTPGRLRSVPSSQGASIFVASLPVAPPRSEFSSAGVEAGRVQSGDAGRSQGTGDFKFQRKEPDVAFSSNYLLTEPWIFLGLSDAGCEQLWLWILQSVPNPPTISFSTEILFRASNSNPYQIWSLLYFSLFIQHGISPSAVGDFLWSRGFSEIARLYQCSNHSA